MSGFLGIATDHTVVKTMDIGVLQLQV